MLSSIALGIKSTEQEHIHDCKTANATWTHLEELYRGKGMHHFLSSLKSLAQAKLRDRSMKNYIRDIMKIGSEMAEMEHKLEDIVIMAFILNDLPDKYRYLVVNLESRLESEDMSFQKLEARLLDEELRINKDAGNRPSIEPAALIAGSFKSRRTRKFCENFEKTGHTEDDCWAINGVPARGGLQVISDTRPSATTKMSRFNSQGLFAYESRLKAKGA